jgi:hypothetical protein
MGDRIRMKGNNDDRDDGADAEQEAAQGNESVGGETCSLFFVILLDDRGDEE